MSSVPHHPRCPVFPPPLKGKAALWKLFFKKQRSWMDGLYDRSYQMKMGEVRLPGVHLYMVNQPDLVRRVMIDDVAQFPKHKMMGDILEPLLGESIFTTNGRQWQKQREMLNPAFEMARVQYVFSLMQDAVTAMEARLAARADLADIDIDHEMTYVTADIIFRTILSVSIEEDEARAIFDAFVLFQKESPRAALHRVFNLPSWWPFGRRAEKKRLAAGEEIRAALTRVIRPRYDAGPGAGDEQDILASLLKSVDPDTGGRFSFNEIVDQVAMLFLAGHETSASALTWSLYLLSLNPEVQEDARREVMDVLAAEPLGVSAIRRMGLVRDVFREALRLYPPVGFFARECAEKTKMRDKKMPKGSVVVVAPWLIHRHREYWDNPDGFDPYRFSRDKGKVSMRDIFLPFGMGPRVCIGTAFAMQEAGLILATLLKTYRVDPVDGFVPEPVGRITVRSDNGMRVRLTRREEAA
jgi:cytochrome P450